MASPGQFGLLAQLAGAKQQSLLDRTIQEYPGIADQLAGVAFKVSPQQKGDHRGLEFYAPGEEEDSFDRTRPAIEVFDPNTQPKDVAGDLVSHWLARGADPVVAKAYRDFEQSLTPEQVRTLHNHYAWDQKDSGEKRSYEDWYRMSGLPAYFRGYMFRQWDENDGPYTPEQRRKFDELNRYLKTPKKKK